MLTRLGLCLIAILGMTAVPLMAAGSPKTAIKGSGLPIPRFVMTKATKVNLRVGPGNHYPTRVVYTRKGIPLIVVAEFDFWRKVKDMDGQEGWAHKTLLANSKLVWVKADMTSMLADPNDPKSIVLHAEKGVEGEYLNDQRNGYAKVKIDGQKGWVLIRDVWGILPQ